MARHCLFADILNQLRHPHNRPFLPLLWWEKGRIKQTHTGTKHGDGETLLLKDVEELLKCNITLDFKAVPKLIELNLLLLAILIVTQIFALGRADGLGETKEGKRKVDKAVLVLLGIGLPVDEFVELKNDETGNKRSGLAAILAYSSHSKLYLGFLP